MVLQDVNNSSPDRFGNDSYPSDEDPYGSSSTSSTSRFDASTLPQPLPVVGVFIGFSETAVRYKTETTLKFAESKVGRNLTGEESQALAFHIYKLEQTKSYYAAAGALGGGYRWYNTWDKLRYPFYQPDLAKINPNKFLFVKGPMAQLARHTWRFALYALVGGQMGSFIGQLVAQPLAAINTSNDARLEAFGNELKATAQVPGHAPAQKQQFQQDKREFEQQLRNREGMGPSPQARWGQQAAQKSDGDDQSPTADIDAWGSDTSSDAASWGETPERAQQSLPQRRSAEPSRSWDRRSPPSRPAQPSSPTSFDDDASPTGGTGALFQDEVMTPEGNSQQRTRPGESSWDRLRRGGAPAPIQRTQGHHKEQPSEGEGKAGTVGDSYAFVEDDEQRRKARERAQREFDARIERERRGKDFSNDDEKRW